MQTLPGLAAAPAGFRIGFAAIVQVHKALSKPLQRVVQDPKSLREALQRVVQEPEDLSAPLQ